MRDTWISRDVSAGCFTCHGSDAHWTGKNAQAVAARHHDATRHPVWCDVSMSIRYGADAADPRQADIEDSIAAAKSGDRPEAVPLPVPDASDARTTDVSAPEGRSSRSALAAIQPEHVVP